MTVCLQKNNVEAEESTSVFYPAISFQAAADLKKT
jgi:hypothetical protein